MIIQGGMVFQEDGSFHRQELYIEGHRIVSGREQLTDRTVIDAKGLLAGTDRYPYTWSRRTRLF